MGMRTHHGHGSAPVKAGRFLSAFHPRGSVAEASRGKAADGSFVPEAEEKRLATDGRGMDTDGGRPWSRRMAGWERARSLSDSLSRQAGRGPG